MWCDMSKGIYTEKLLHRGESRRWVQSGFNRKFSENWGNGLNRRDQPRLCWSHDFGHGFEYLI